MTTISNVLNFISQKGMSTRAFEEQAGLSNGTLSKVKPGNDLSDENIDKIIERFSTELLEKGFIIFDLNVFGRSGNAIITQNQLIELKKRLGILGDLHQAALEPIEIKTASGKTITIAVEGNNEITMLNALFEERDRFIEEQKIRQRETESVAKKMEEHYQDAKNDKEQLYGLLHKFKESLDTNLNVIQKNLGDNRDYLELLVRVVRTNDGEIMDALDSLEGEDVGTRRKRAGKKERAVSKTLKGDGK